MDPPASSTAAPASSSSEIQNSNERTEALITPGAAVGTVPEVSEYEKRTRIHRRGSRRGQLKGKEPSVTLTFEPQGAGADQQAAIAAIIDVAYPHIGAVAVIRQADAEYRASKDTPERLEEHRARMSFFKGTSDGPHLDPESNPLYNIWESWATSVQFIDSDDLPLAMGLAKPVSEFTDGQRLRDSAILEYSYAVPSAQVLQYMVKRAPGGKIVEVGAGSGYWADLLHKLGADVVAVDNGLEVFSGSFFPACKKQDGSVFLASGEADGRALFLCWPGMKDDPNMAAATFLDNFRGDTIFFVGEVGGTTFCMMEWLEEHKDRGWLWRKQFPFRRGQGCMTSLCVLPRWLQQNEEVQACNFP